MTPLRILAYAVIMAFAAFWVVVAFVFWATFARGAVLDPVPAVPFEIRWRADIFVKDYAAMWDIDVLDFDQREAFGSEAECNAYGRKNAGAMATLMSIYFEDRIRNVPAADVNIRFTCEPAPR